MLSAVQKVQLKSQVPTWNIRDIILGEREREREREREKERGKGEENWQKSEHHHHSRLSLCDLGYYLTEGGDSVVVFASYFFQCMCVCVCVCVGMLGSCFAMPHNTTSTVVLCVSNSW